MAVRDAARAGIVHRDIKPNNVVRREDGQVFLVDVGIAADLAASVGLTTTAEGFGNQAFAAPECGPGSLERAMDKSDVYRLGKLLYWLVADGRVIHREVFGDREVALIGADSEWMRRWIASLIYGTVREAPDSRWTVDELLIGLERTKAKPAEYEAHTEAGELVVWDGFGPNRAFNVSSSRSATRATRERTAIAHDVAMAVDVAGNDLAELVRIEVALADIGAGLGAASVQPTSEGVSRGTAQTTP